MNDEIQGLLDSLRRGQYEDPAENIALLAAALHEGKAEEALLESLPRTPQIPLRLAALEACRLRKFPALERVIGTLTGPVFRTSAGVGWIHRSGSISHPVVRVFSPVVNAC